MPRKHCIYCGYNCNCDGGGFIKGVQSYHTEVGDFEVLTTVHKSGLVFQREKFLNNIITKMFDTKDKHVRKALIALGWTPPKDDTETDTEILPEP